MTTINIYMSMHNLGTKLVDTGMTLVKASDSMKSRAIYHIGSMIGKVGYALFNKAAEKLTSIYGDEFNDGIKVDVDGYTMTVESEIIEGIDVPEEVFAEYETAKAAGIVD